MNNTKEQIILSALGRFKKKQGLTIHEKMDIFMHVYNLKSDERPADLRRLIDIVLDEYGESFTMSQEYDKQTFLNIYGEPKKNSLLLNKIDDALDIVLGELAIRNDLAPIFPPTSNNKSSLTPYSKDNSIEFLAMKKLNMYSSYSFEINRLINNLEHTEFPMTDDLFESLSWIQEFEEASEPVFERIKSAFKNTRQNYSAIFIEWFNSHFWKEQYAQVEFEDDLDLFNTVFAVFIENADIQLTINENHIRKESSTPIVILGGGELSEMGQEYFRALYPFNTVRQDLLQFR